MILGAAGPAVAGSATADAAPAVAVPAAPRRPPSPPTRSILIGTGGLTWSDVSSEQTPALWSFLRDGSTAALSVRSVFTNTCPIDGWLSLSAGNRAAAPGPEEGGARRTTEPCAADPGGRERGRARAGTASSRRPVPSGSTPGWGCSARPSPATSSASRRSGPAPGSAPRTAPAPCPGTRAFAPRRADRATHGCRVTLVDVGSLRDPDDVAEGEQQAGAGQPGRPGQGDRPAGRRGARGRADRLGRRRGQPVRRRDQRAAAAGRGQGPGVRHGHAVLPVDPAARAGAGVRPDRDPAHRGHRRPVPGDARRPRRLVRQDPRGQLRGGRPGPAAAPHRLRRRQPRRARRWCRRSSTAWSTPRSRSTSSRRSSGVATSAPPTAGCGCCGSCDGSPSSRRASRPRPSWPTSSRGGGSRCRSSPSPPRVGALRRDHLGGRVPGSVGPAA